MGKLWAYTRSNGQSGLRISRSNDVDLARLDKTDYDELLFDSLNEAQIRITSVEDFNSIGDVPLTNPDTYRRLYVETGGGWQGLFFGVNELRRTSGPISYYSGSFRFYHCSEPSFFGDSNFKPISKVYIVDFDLPGNSDSVGYNEGPARSGDAAVRIATDGVKIARSGYSVDSTNDDHVLIDDSRQAAQIIASGEILVNNGQTVSRDLPKGIDYGGDMVVDCIGRRTNETDYYDPPEEFDAAYYITRPQAVLEARISGDKVEFRNNAGFNMFVRYFVLAQDSRPPVTSSTGQPLLREVDDNTGSYVQMLRVGSTIPPRLGDILVDSRFGYMPIVKEGLLEFTAPGGNDGAPTPPQVYDVNLPVAEGQNWRSFVFFSTYAESGGWSRYNGAIIERLLITGDDFNYAYGSKTIYARLSTDKLSFYLYQRHPREVRWNVRGNILDGYTYSKSIFYTPYTSRISKIRYYVFAIPII